MISRFCKTLSVLIALILVCGHAAAASFSKTHTLTVQNLERRYHVYLPTTYSPQRAWPVVIMFHGAGGQASAALRETGWGDKADRESFIAVFPEGTAPDPSRPPSFRGNPQTWNDGSDRGIGATQRNVDDVTFVRRMIDDLAVRYTIDPRRVYATGFSNGAALTFRLGREMPTTFAAIAPVSGTDWMASLTPNGTVPLLYIMGMADPLNPYEGGEIRIGRRSYGIKPPALPMMREWAQQQACAPDAQILEMGDGVTAIRFAPCRDKTEVLCYAVEGLGHHWPGGPASLPEAWAGPRSDRLNATDVIWNFFSRHTR